MKTMSDDICMIKEQFPENMFSEAASKLKIALKSTKKSTIILTFFQMKIPINVYYSLK